jgi:hypothetical protein
MLSRSRIHSETRSLPLPPALFLSDHAVPATRDCPAGLRPQRCDLRYSEAAETEGLSHLAGYAARSRARSAVGQAGSSGCPPVSSCRLATCLSHQDRAPCSSAARVDRPTVAPLAARASSASPRRRPAPGTTRTPPRPPCSLASWALASSSGIIQLPTTPRPTISPLGIRNDR